jgi:mono/diheme cytochrome c family protein
MRSSGGNAFGAVEVAQVTALIAEIERAAAGPAVRSATSAAGWYPNEQAAPGKALDQECCANCHGDNFVADDFATGLTGAAFGWRWKDRTVFDFFETIRRTMPPGEGGVSDLGPRWTSSRTCCRRMDSRPAARNWGSSVRC